MKNLPKENVGANEAGIIADIVAGTIADQKRDYKPGSLARRDVHSKSHGTFTDARIKILDRVLAGNIGLFGKSGYYFAATVRLSNGAPGVGPDVLPNVRGFRRSANQQQRTNLPKSRDEATPPRVEKQFIVIQRPSPARNDEQLSCIWNEMHDSVERYAVQEAVHEPVRIVALH